MKNPELKSLTMDNIGGNNGTFLYICYIFLIAQTCRRTDRNLEEYLLSKGMTSSYVKAN